jgi:hypothetical protein
MDEDSSVILAAILGEIQEAELPDLSARMVKVFESLGKLARNHWLKRRPQPGGDDIWYGSQRYWQEVREFLERRARSEQPAQSEEAGDSSLNSVSNGPVTLGSLTWLAEEAVNPKRPSHYRAAARQKLELSLRTARSEKVSSEGRMAFEAMRLIAELTASIGGIPPAVRVERVKVNDLGKCEVQELPSLTKRSQNSGSEREILEEFEREQSPPLRRACLERLRWIGGPVVAERLSSRLASIPHPLKCQVLRVLDELAIQGYVPQDDETQRDNEAETVEGVLEHLERALRAEKPCGLLDQVIDGVRKHHAAILNGDFNPRSGGDGP